MKILIKFLGRFILCILLFAALFSLSALAEGEEESSVPELYNRQLQSSGAMELQENLPEETTDLLDDLGLDLSEPQTLFDPKTENILDIILNFFTTGISAPLKATLSVMGILLIFASVEGLIADTEGSGITVFVCFMGSLALLEPVYGLIYSVQSAIQGISTFMLSFVPVYAGIMLSSGSTATAGGFSTLLLGAAECISQLISYCFIPIAGGCMCLGICGGISPVGGIIRLCEWIKKSANWVMGIASTLFLSVLSLQTTVTAAGDSLGLRTSKAVLSSTVPVMGPAVAETLNIAKGCLSLLRSGVGIYAVAAIALLALPVIVELVLWRVAMWLSSGVAEMFGLLKVTGLFRSIDFCLSILTGALCFTAVLFIISLTIGTRTV